MSLNPTGGNIVGYNAQAIEELGSYINSIASKTGSNIVERLHTSIIVPMSTVWYAPEAKSFFEGLATAVEQSGEAITDAFDAFRNAIQEAGRVWAEATGGAVPTLSSICKVELILCTSEIQSSNAGSVTIDVAQATAIANSVSEVRETIRTDLQTLADQLDAESAFIGQGQAQAVAQCFATISECVDKIFDYLTEGEDSLQRQINKAAKKYKDMSGEVSSAFTN